MKVFTLGCFLFSGLALAEPLKLNVTNFNFNYQNPLGEGSATSFTRNNQKNNEVQVKVEKSGTDFHLNVTGAENHEFEFKDAPAFMTEAETMEVRGFNLNLAEGLTLTLGSGRFYSKEDTLKLDGVNLSCARNLNLESEMDQLISGCISKMSLKSSKFSSQSLDANFMTVLTDSIVKAIDPKGDIGVNSLDLKTTNGKYDLSGEVKAKMSGKVKSNGNISYDPNNGTLTLKISEVKFSFLNITGKVFDELRKNENENMRVKEPYVYYKIKKESN